MLSSPKGTSLAGGSKPGFGRQKNLGSRVGCSGLKPTTFPKEPKKGNQKATVLPVTTGLYP